MPNGGPFNRRIDPVPRLQETPRRTSAEIEKVEPRQNLGSRQARQPCGRGEAAPAVLPCSSMFCICCYTESPTLPSTLPW